MSALPPEADMLIVGINVCFVPIADKATRAIRPIRIPTTRKLPGGRKCYLGHCPDLLSV